MKRPLTVGRALAAMLIGVVVVLALNLAVTAWVFRSLCDVVSAQVAAFRETPPSTPAGASARDAWSELELRICRGGP